MSDVGKWFNEDLFTEVFVLPEVAMGIGPIHIQRKDGSKCRLYIKAKADGTFQIFWIEETGELNK